MAIKISHTTKRIDDTYDATRRAQEYNKSKILEMIKEGPGWYHVTDVFSGLVTSTVEFSDSYETLAFNMPTRYSDRLPNVVIEHLSDGHTCEVGAPERDCLITDQNHYVNCGIQPIELMKKNFSQEEYRGYLNGNILKYLLRYQRKNGIEDLRKANTYLSWLIEFELKAMGESK